jgi:hypothetical protein
MACGIYNGDEKPFATGAIGSPLDTDISDPVHNRKEAGNILDEGEDRVTGPLP